MKIINKIRWCNIPNLFKEHHTLLKFSPEEIISKYNCLQAVKSGDVVRFLNYNHADSTTRFDPSRLRPTFYLFREELIYFDAILVSSNILKIRNYLSGYFMIPDNFSIKEYYGNHNILREYHNNILYKEDFDLKLVGQLLLKWSGNYFWTHLTSSPKPFFPIRIFKQHNAQY